MSYASNSLQQALTQCHYDQTTKNFLYSEQMHVLQTYQMNFKAVSAKLPSGNFTILEVCGTIPVNFQSNTYNIPIKLHYLPGYPNGPPVLIVNPSADMMIKPSEFVRDDGKATLSIFNAWNSRLNTLLVLDEAKRAFGIKMPVFKKPKSGPSNSSPASGGFVQGSQNTQIDPRYSSVPAGYPGQGNPYNTVGPGYPGQVNPSGLPGPAYPGSQPGYPQGGYSSVQPTPSIYSSVQPGYSTSKQSSSYSTVSTVQPGNIIPRQGSIPVPGYSTVPASQNPSYSTNPSNPSNPSKSNGQVDPRYTSFNQIQPARNTIPSPTLEKINKIYKKTIEDLKAEVEILQKESKQLESNSNSITQSIENFKAELNSGKNKLALMRVNIENSQEWVETYSSSTMSDLNEEELVEYRNDAAKQYISLFSEEKSLESTVQVLVEAINKSVVPAKENLVVLKKLYTDLFLVTRLKEKAEGVSRGSN